MSQGLLLLDEALQLAHKEKAALEGGEYTEAIELAEKRGELTTMAWNVFNVSDQENYKSKLLELSGIQKQLTKIAAAAQDVIRKSLNHSRLEKKRIMGYHQAVSQALQ